LWAWAAGTTPWADWINQGGAVRALPAFNLGMACYLFRDRIARWPTIPGALAASLAAFIVLGSVLPTMTVLIAIYAIAILAVQADCAGRETLRVMICTVLSSVMDLMVTFKYLTGQMNISTRLFLFFKQKNSTYLYLQN